MKDLLIRFVTLDVMVTHPLIPWVILGIWVILIAATILSLRNQDWSAAAQWSWLALVVGLPIIGLFAYSVVCLVRGNWTFIKPLLQSRSKSVRAVTQGFK